MESFVRNFKLEDQSVENQKIVCKECCRETSHKIVTSYYEDGSQDCGNGNTFDWSSRNQIIQCLGCESVSFRVISSNSEDYDFDENGFSYYSTEKYYPARTEGLKGISVYLLPDSVQAIYQETILAIENEQNILAGIGIRALIETICKDKLAKGKNLYEKIDDLKEQSILTKEGAETLHKLRILGNDAAHEVKSHNTDQLSLAIQIIEHMLEGTYIIPHKVSSTFK